MAFFAILVGAEAYALTCAIAGETRATRPVIDPVGAALCGVAAAFGVLTALAFHDPDVSFSRLALGALWGAGLYAFAAAVFYIVGRVLLSRSTVLGGIVVFVLMAGLVAYMVAALFAIADFAGCTPDEYECPV